MGSLGLDEFRICCSYLRGDVISCYYCYSCFLDVCDNGDVAGSCVVVDCVIVLAYEFDVEPMLVSGELWWVVWNS